MRRQWHPGLGRDPVLRDTRALRRLGKNVRHRGADMERSGARDFKDLTIAKLVQIRIFKLDE